MKFFIIMLLSLMIAGNAWAQHNPKYPRGKVLTDDEVRDVKSFLAGKISVRMTPALNDYKEEFDRGTVRFNPDIRQNGQLQERNYSYTKVVIANGTTVMGVNFSQKTPGTNAITGENLTFVNCQLTNVAVNPTWKLINSSNNQRKQIVLDETPLDSERTQLTISTQVLSARTGKYVEINQHEEVIDNDSLPSYRRRFNAE